MGVKMARAQQTASVNQKRSEVTSYNSTTPCTSWRWKALPSNTPHQPLTAGYVNLPTPQVKFIDFYICLQCGGQLFSSEVMKGWCEIEMAYFHHIGWHVYKWTWHLACLPFRQQWDLFKCGLVVFSITADSALRPSLHLHESWLVPALHDVQV